MLNQEQGLNNVNQNLNNHLVRPANNLSGQLDDNKIEKTIDTRNVKFSYPKNGLYGLL